MPTGKRNRRPSLFLMDNSDCVRRKLDLTRLADYFRARGFRLRKRPHEADIIILITCAYTEEKQEQCRRAIAKLDRFGGELIVGGCFPEIAPEKFARAFSGRFLTTRNLEAIDVLFPGAAVKLAEMPDANRPAEYVPPFYLERGLVPALLYMAREAKRRLTGAGRETPAKEEACIRVGWGCAGRCTYCAIHRAIGPPRSKRPETCVEEYSRLLAGGYGRIVLVADDIGLWGLDLKSTLPHLLDRLAEAGDGRQARWDIRQLSPGYAVKYRDSLLHHAGEGRIDEFLCAVQTGCPRILAAMKRPVNPAELEKLFADLRRTVPSIRLKTDVIVGFPGENEADFRENLAFLERIRFDQVRLFPYSDVPGTPAAAMPEKVPRATLEERLRRARAALEREGVTCLLE